MHLFKKVAMSLVLLFSLSGCIALNYMGASYLKDSLMEECGTEDKCINVVKTKFDPCHKKYERRWHAYMNSVEPSKEDELLNAYLSKLTQCMVDSDGHQYFDFNDS